MTRTRTVAAVILAAGKGKRLRSARPKVLHPICGRPALWRVVQTVLAARPDRVVIVVGHGADDVREEVSSWGITPKPVFVDPKRRFRSISTIDAKPRGGFGPPVIACHRAVYHTP